MRRIILPFGCLVLALLAACGGDGAGTPAAKTTAATTAAGASPPPDGITVVAAGDIGACDSAGDEAVAALVASIDGPILIPGDIAYESGSPQEFARCFDPSWGAFRERMHPAPGNHEYGTAGAAGYFAYFGAAAGSPGQSYYSFDIGAWHIVALDSNCRAIGGCGEGSAEERWLRDDLAAHPAQCTLAFWHHPRFSSGLHGGDDSTAALWRALQDAGAELVLSGHDHDYERFAPMDANGRRDDARGLRQFVVGTGGRSLYPIVVPRPNSESRSNASFGVLQLTLAPGEYRWRYTPVAGAFSDSGSATCR